MRRALVQAVSAARAEGKAAASSCGLLRLVILWVFHGFPLFVYASSGDFPWFLRFFVQIPLFA